MKSSFTQYTGVDLRVKIADIGASILTDKDRPPYRELLDCGAADIIGFEPSPVFFSELNKRKGPYETYLPHALGDGKRHTLYVCQAPGMTSLLEPDPKVLELFAGFSHWGKVLSKEEIDTVRMDDVPEMRGVDMLKIDVQGAELMILSHGIERLKDMLLVQVEAEFLPQYKNQPLFAEVDQFMRSQGFAFHRFYPLIMRPIAPITINGNWHDGISQILWCDAVYVRDFTRLDLLSDLQLLKSAMLIHECYYSFDLVNHFLREYDRRHGSKLSDTYINNIISSARNARIAAENGGKAA